MQKIYQNTLILASCSILLISNSVLAIESETTQSNNKPAIASNILPIKPANLTLDDAIAKALANSPHLKSFNYAVAAAKGELRQSTAWVNPELRVDTDNFAGKGIYKGFDSAELTFGVTQEITIGGKISARENIAKQGLNIATLDEQAAILDMIRDVTISFVELVAAEENINIAVEQKELADAVLKSVTLRVGVAAAPLIQKSRAEVERSTAVIALDKVQRKRDIARKKFVTLIGEDSVLPLLDKSYFYSITKPEMVMLDEKLKNNPDIVKLDNSLSQSKAKLDLEKANAIPDPKLSAGVREFRDGGNKAFLVGISLPIPVFNANRGNVEKASNEVIRTEMDNKQAALNLSSELTQAYKTMENAYIQTQMLKTEILPSADKAFKLAREGYGLGRFPYLEVLDAQRSFFNAKQQQIEAITEFHSSKAQIERLTASNINKLQKLGNNHE